MRLDTFDNVQNVYADFLDRDETVETIQCNVQFEDTGINEYILVKLLKIFLNRNRNFEIKKGKMLMNILDLIDTKVSSYTKTDRVIYEKLKKFPDRFAQNSYSESVREFNVSPAALTRFAKKLGFSGFNEFQFQLAADLQNRKNEGRSSGMAEKYGKALVRTEESVGHEQLSMTADKLIRAEKIFCLGFNSSSLPARSLWDTLRSEFDFNAEMTDYDYIFSNYSKNDVIVIFSVASGSFYHSLLQRICKEEERNRPQIILVTMNPKHPLRKYCTDVILLPSAGGMYQTHAAVLENMIFLMFIDLLVTEIHHHLNKK